MPLTSELQTLINALCKEKIVALLAPSFPVDFEYPQIILNLKMIGVQKVVELTYAAKLINMEYERILKENPDKRYICPNCPTIVKMIEVKYPELKEYIIDVASPMVVMDRFVKKQYGPEYKTLFIGPCFAKKMEAKQYGIDYAITFKELQEIFDYRKENNIPDCEFTFSVTEDGTPDFDKFYNDYTKVYPLAGGVADSLHVKGILTRDQILVVDGPKNLDAGFQEFKSNENIKFLDILACEGGCIGGPGMMSKEPIEARKQKVLDYKQYCKKDKIGSKLGKFEYGEGLDITRTTDKT
ncbi:MAG: [Fe-Fe] hydrogenase large subunit C-terminal domain-containing protein [Candidatus Absconditabacterales bacterium]